MSAYQHIQLHSAINTQRLYSIVGETVAYHVQSPLVHFLLWGPTLGAHKSPYGEPSALVEDTVQIQKKLFLSN